MGAKTQIGGDAHNEGNRNKLVLFELGVGGAITLVSIYA